GAVRTSSRSARATPSEVFAGLLNCRPENVAFASSATHAYSTALSAIPFEAGSVILTTRNDFISNQIAFLSLRKRFGVRVVHAPDLPEGGVDVSAMADLMRELRPALVAATHIPTNSGLVQPVAEIGRHARELGLPYLVDACQSVGQLPVDVEEIGCDFLTSTCRTFLRGPRGSGFLYVSDRVLGSGLEPLFLDMYGARWTSAESYTPMTTAQRFEDWEFPYATLLGCAAAVAYARGVGLDVIGRRTPALAAELRRRLEGTPGLRLLDHGSVLGGIVTVEVAGWQPDALKAGLDDAGINSALSLRQFAQFDFSDKQVDWCVRLAPHYYNTIDEVDIVADVMRGLAAERQ
ncbi:aminotransferase class V-fold PLP-dependent enzyme, partial [Intrasporangium sp.]|uniref:aminotransferase class V-fold PLP-dependent enzyme n=1 Tax=Intrasporangium sp. TaxID=1925024 RepID=UPI00293954B8